MYDEWFVDGIVGEKEVNCRTALVVVMKAIALLCTVSNRLKYQTLLAHTHTHSISEGKNQCWSHIYRLMFRNLNALTFYIWAMNMDASQKAVIIRFHLIGLQTFFLLSQYFSFKFFSFVFFFAIANSVSVLSSRTMCSSFGTLKCSKYKWTAPLKNFSIFLFFSLSLAP